MAEQRRCRRAEQKRSANGGTPDADVATRAPAFHQEDRRDLQKLNAEGNSREHADGEVAGAERDRKADQEDAGGQRPHRLARERIVENEPQQALLVRVPWPDWIAELERTRYDNPKYVPVELLESDSVTAVPVLVTGLPYWSWTWTAKGPTVAVGLTA